MGQSLEHLYGVSMSLGIILECDREPLYNINQIWVAFFADHSRSNNVQGRKFQEQNSK